MVQPGSVGVELDVGRWRRSLAVHQVQRVATEGVGGVEDATGSVGLPFGHSVQMVLPRLVGVEGPGFRDVEHGSVPVEGAVVVREDGARGVAVGVPVQPSDRRNLSETTS